MQKEKTTDWHQMTGELDFNMTNDFLFRALLQENNHVLAALSASMMGWDEAEVTSAKIENPIELRGAFDSKEFILDVKVCLNTSMTVNLEMQVINRGNWPERSLAYMCRSFDNLNRGDDYKEIRPVYQIGITDFSPIKESHRFFSRYMFQEVEDHNIYSDKIGMFVLDLTAIERADENDRRYKRNLWAEMFKAESWEDLKMLAQENPAIDEAVGQVYKITRDEMLRQRMEAREEYNRIERTNQRILEELKAQVTGLKTKVTDLEAKNSDLETENTEIKAELAKYKAQEHPTTP